MATDYRTYHVAKLYYIDGYKQNEIAEMLHISTMLVSRLLKKAEEEKIVVIQVHAPNNNDAKMAGELRKKYPHLREATVVKMDPGVDRRQQLGQAAAQYVESIIHDDCTIGISWGKTLFSLVNSLHPTTSKNIRVLQLSGGFLFRSNHLMMPSNLLQLASERLRCEAIYLNTPIYVASKEVSHSLREDPYIRYALEESQNSEINLMGVSRLGEQSTMSLVSIIDETDLGELRFLGAIGDIMGEFVDSDGNVVTWSKSDCYMGAKIEKLHPQAYNICIAGEEEKAILVDLAIKKKYVNTLIVSQEVAQKMLKEE